MSPFDTLPHLESSPARRAAGERCIETLLNCYCREVAMPENQSAVVPLFGPQDWPRSLCCALARGPVLHLRLPRLDTQLVVAVDHDSPTGNHRYRSDVFVREASGEWSPCDWHKLARLLIRDLSARSELPFNHELLEQIENSVQVTTDILQHAPEARAATTPLEAYLDSEQSLTFGHPFHPSPKSRQGFNRQDLLRYSPELRGGFPLHYFAVRHDALHQQSTLPASCTEILAGLAPAGLEAGDGYALIPAHPWQARWLMDHPLVADAMRSGRIRHLGPQGAPFHPTSSVRTLFQPGNPYFYKFSLNVRLTNCIRTNAVYELEGALAVNRIMTCLLPGLRELFPGASILEEPAFVSVDLKAGDAAANRAVTEGFGLILRRSFDARNLPHGTTPVVAGCLFGDHVLGEARLQPILERLAAKTRQSLDAVTEEWFSRYVQQVMYPTLHCHFAHHVVIESHLQNVVIGLAGDWPSHIFLRDFEGVKLVAGSFPEEELPNVSPRAREALLYDPDKAWNRISYCLFVNNFCEAIHHLAPSNPSLQRKLWSQVRHHLQRYQAEYGTNASATRIRPVLDGEPLPNKANLSNRFFKQADRAATYLPLTNPIGQPAKVSA
jgi:siderophore synthetase component